jgi:hypothetical protein
VESSGPTSGTRGASLELGQSLFAVMCEWLWRRQGHKFVASANSTQSVEKEKGENETTCGSAGSDDYDDCLVGGTSIVGSGKNIKGGKNVHSGAQYNTVAKVAKKERGI